MVTFLPLTTGGLARLSLLFGCGWPFSPNQYSGRYIRYWKSNRFRLLMLALSMYGKMYVGGLDGGSAQTAVPPLTGVFPDDVELPLLLQPAATTASAAAAAAAARSLRWTLDRDVVRCAADLMAAVPSDAPRNAIVNPQRSMCSSKTSRPI